MGRTTSTTPDPYAIALLRGGDRAAVTVAVLALHLRGAAEADRPGSVRRTGPRDGGSVRHPLEKAVRTALFRPARPRELPGRVVVRRALAKLRAELVAAGLVRVVPPVRTRAARQYLAGLREDHALPADPQDLTEDEVLLGVALYGEPALKAVAPRFARWAGLTGRGSIADRGRMPFTQGNSSRGGMSDYVYLGYVEGFGGGGYDSGGGSHHGHDSGGGGGCGSSCGGGCGGSN
jgi:hypothetical protein